MNKNKIIASFFLLFILFSCDKYDLLRNNPKDPKSNSYKPALPVLSTTDASAITPTTATLGGNITADGGATVTARGVCWSTTTNPTVTLTTKTVDGTGISTFVSNLTGLASSTTFYARAYATNSSGTAYGLNVTFTTLAALTAPIITTTAVSPIGLTSAVSGGNVTSDGGSGVTARGVCWSINTNPTIALTTKTVDSLGVGIFTSKITGLTAGSLYHVRAYAKNSVGTSYGTDLSFTTLTVAAIPSISTVTPTGIAMISAVSGGNVTFDGGANVTDRGVCWGTAPNPTVALTTKTSDGTGTGAFTSSITGLTAGTTYHVRAYATNSSGTGYGNDLTFTTNTVASVSTVNTTAISDLTLSSATSGGNVISDGGAAVTTRGICWSTTSNPTTSNSKINSGSGTGVYAITITGLAASTVYHVRAYATNSSGTGYGADVSFTTNATAVVPILSTTAITSITSGAAISGGNITSDNGAAVTGRGVCWSTTANPTVALTTKTTDGNGTGSFISNITGLTGGTTYHVRAYATNTAGTSYGTDILFTTSASVIPTITTTPVTANLGVTAVSGGNISSDGGDAVTARGVCWGLALNPTTADFKTPNGTGSGSFVSNLSGLTIGTTYHIRAYATNTLGTAYGQDIVFTTPNIPTVTTSAMTSITPTTASGGGEVTLDGGAIVTESGICWSTSTDPTIALTTKIASSSGIGIFYSNITGLNASTTYYVRAYATNSVGTSYGANVTFITSIAVIPTVKTTDLTAITLNTATSGGEVTANGGAAITARGVCWGTTTTPTVAGSKTIDGTGISIFTSGITSLLANTTYYLRAYATNSAGTAYGNEEIFRTAHSTLTDVEGNIYYAVGIGTQVWMRENLKTTKYRDANFIVNVTDNTAWGQLITGAYCWYSNDITNKTVHGALYNWYTITDSRGLCPTGWHVPTDAEWTTMVTFLGGNTSGGKLKETGIIHWSSPNTGATNETGFTALPGGSRNYAGAFATDIGNNGYWWNSTESSTTNANSEIMYYYNSNVSSSAPLKGGGYSIRCVKD
jgi:uncharacterized protein (TIGR02145 family)